MSWRCCVICLQDEGKPHLPRCRLRGIVGETTEEAPAAAKLLAVLVAPFLFSSFTWGLLRFPLWLLDVDATQPVAKAGLAVFALIGLAAGVVGGLDQLKEDGA